MINLHPNHEGRQNMVEVNPRMFIRETDNIMAVDLFPDGENPPLIFYTYGGRRYLVEVTVYDVTEVPYYARKGLKERLAAERAKADGE